MSEENETPAAPLAKSPILPNITSKPSDHAVRPGFRSPSNKGSKAQKGRKKRKGKR